MAAVAGYRTPLVKGRTARFTLLDACGNPVAGAASQFVTTGLITAKKTEKWDAGTELKSTTAAGSVSVYEPAISTLLGYDIDIEFDAIDTGALPMISGDPLVLGYDGSPVGWEATGLTAHTGHNFALELWTGVSGQACTGGAVPFGYWVFPQIGNVYSSLDDFDNKVINVHVKGFTYAGQSWGKGPYTVVGGDSSNTPSRLLQPLGSTSHFHFERTVIPPPAASTGGPTALTLPSPY